MGNIQKSKTSEQPVWRYNPMTDTTERVHEPVQTHTGPFILPEDAIADGLISKAIIDTTIEPPDEPACITINGVNIGSIGSFIQVNGKAKSRKTHFSALLAAAGLGGEVGNITVTLPDDKRRVIYFDTEQSAKECYNTARKIIKTAGLDPDTQQPNLTYLNMRAMTPDERTKVVDRVLETTPDAGLVFIDGPRDLISDINSPQEATTMATNMLRWTSTYHVHIVSTLHMNKADNNARGHVGAELCNKAQSVINIEKTTEGQPFSVVTFVEGRDTGFTPFNLGYDPHDLPVVVDGEPATKQKKGVASIPHAKHLQYLGAIFDGREGLTWTELRDLMKPIYGISAPKTVSDYLKWLREETYLNYDVRQKLYTFTPFSKDEPRYCAAEPENEPKPLIQIDDPALPF